MLSTLSPSMDSKESQPGVIRAYKRSKHTRTEQLTPSLLDSQNSASLESSGRARMNNFSCRSLHNDNFMKFDAEHRITLSPYHLRSIAKSHKGNKHTRTEQLTASLLDSKKERQFRLQSKSESWQFRFQKSTQQKIHETWCSAPKYLIAFDRKQRVSHRSYTLMYRKRTHQYRTTDASFMIRFTKQRQFRLQLQNESWKILLQKST